MKKFLFSITFISLIIGVVTMNYLFLMISLIGVVFLYLSYCVAIYKNKCRNGEFD